MRAEEVAEVGDGGRVRRVDLVLKPRPFFWVADVVGVKEGLEVRVKVPGEDVIWVVQLEFGYSVG